MASESEDRDLVLRAKLVAHVSGQAAQGASPTPRPYAGRLSAALVTAFVLIVVVGLSITALRLGGERGRPAVGGSSAPAESSEASSNVPAPVTTLPAGPVLGRFSSADGPNQEHTIRPDGLALATLFSCTGDGKYLTSIAHWGEQGGDGGCGGSGVSSGNKGVAGSTTVKIRTEPAMRWTFTIVGIPETYVTPRPIPSPTDSDGTAVRYCTSADLTATFRATEMPDGVTAVSGGELVFTNQTAQACALAGYPEVRFLSDGTALGHNTMNHIDERNSTEHGLKAVILKPQGAAYSQVDWYLPGSNADEEGPCVERAVSDVEVDLNYDLADPSQTGTFTVPIGEVTACLNGQHGALGKYGQISSTVFLDYTLAKQQ